jgi:hypothetical protein
LTKRIAGKSFYEALADWTSYSIHQLLSSLRPRKICAAYDILILKVYAKKKKREAINMAIVHLQNAGQLPDQWNQLVKSI